jgi:hypothetical protein
MRLAALASTRAMPPGVPRQGTPAGRRAGRASSAG